LKNNTLWIDIALLYRRLRASPIPLSSGAIGFWEYNLAKKLLAEEGDTINHRRLKRVNRVVDLSKLTPAQTQLIEKFSGAVGAWAAVTPWLRDYLPPPFVGELASLAGRPPGDPLQWARVKVDQYLLQVDARIGAQADLERGIVLTVQGHGLNEYTTRPWFEWQAHPVRLLVCDYCGQAFNPRRSDALFCSASCRNSSSREKMREDRHG